MIVGKFKNDVAAEVTRLNLKMGETGVESLTDRSAADRSKRFSSTRSSGASRKFQMSGKREASELRAVHRCFRAPGALALLKQPRVAVFCLSAMLFALLATGCSSDQKPIVFLSETKVPAFAENSAASASELPGVSKVDEQKIDVAVFSYLLKQKLWDNGNYSAIFLQSDDGVVNSMIQKFPDHNPPIKQSSHLDLKSAQMPLDHDTGLPVMILSADIGEPNADGSVVAVGRWYAGSVVKGDCTFTLKKNGDSWTIASVK